ncbi:DUF4166 domain-containing protein [Streptomyces sp. H10-C2]|uniref:DUF4166 domain-containing protein n=1 Tax=unclassified Streptomyces TaxID=2593676 RepID=UPI0024B972B9|nr:MULTISPECIES: DUF4166 domain-containing protein [unclassified Streptomyces]MDJ0341496.1 DUF4166 domain-containing protein [Streptomyces sp. PH10-H1]MDJ0369153.1 DUF4166 domain-containing protein [Streptomyces sp. H10-C2]
MTSIFQRVLGADFDRLHPRIQRRFSVGLDSGEACVGRGTMDRVWHGPRFVRPFLALGGSRNILVPQTGTDIPFTIENFPYADSFGRETVTFVRTFTFPGRTRRFDATMIHSPERNCVVDYLGTHQHLATDLHFTVDAGGALVIRSGDHRFREGPADFRVPELIAGDAVVRESYDDAAGRFRIEVNVSNRRFGPLFGYEGSFEAEFVDVAERGVRAGLRPVREEARV